MDGHIDGKACCGACAHAAEVAKSGGPVQNESEHLRVQLDESGAPRGVTLVMRGRFRSEEEWSVPVGKALVILGRSRPADVIIDDINLSRRQCSLDFTSGEAVLSDLDSVCGTTVNGSQIRRVALRDGDEIRFGDTILHVRIG